MCVCVWGGGYVFSLTPLLYFLTSFALFLRAPIHVLFSLLDGFRDGEKISSLEHIFLAGSYVTHQLCVSLSVHVWTCQVTDRHHPYLMAVCLSCLFVCFHVR